jgi:exosortase
MTTQTLTENSTAFRRSVLFGIFCAILLAVAFDPLRRLVQLSLGWANTDLSYIVVIPIISLVLIYRDRRSIFLQTRTSIGPAALVFVVGVMLYLLGHARVVTSSEEQNYLAVMTAAVIALFYSGCLLFYGSAVFKAALFPMLFLLLAIPMPTWLLDAFTNFLVQGSSAMVALLFSLTGTPAFREGTSFALPGVTINIAPECSGIRSTLGMYIVTLLGTRLFLKSNPRRILLLIAVVPVSLFKNAVRIVTLTLLAIHVDMRFLTGALHQDGGIVFMMIGLVIMYPILALLMRSEENRLYRGVQA